MNMLFTTPTCPNCPKAKQLLGDKNISFQNIDASTSEGLDLARKYELFQAPSFIKIDDNGELIQAFIGLGEIEKMCNTV